MRFASRAARLAALALTAALPLAAFSPAALAQVQAAAPAAGSLTDWSQRVWTTARHGDSEKLLATLERLAPADPNAPGVAALRDNIHALEANLAKREEQRAARSKELSGELTKALAEGRTDVSLGKALRSAVELELLSTDRPNFLARPEIAELIKTADGAAHAAEARGDWLAASELFYRLHALTEESGKYKKDADRLTQRLAMLRLYVPERLWELRNARQIAGGDKPLPPYNPLGDSFQDKLKGIDETLLLRTMQYIPRHVEQVPLSTVVAGGLDAVKTMVTTRDLRGAFPGLSTDESVNSMVEFLDREAADVRAKGKGFDPFQAEGLLTRLREQNNRSVRVPYEALLHEFGNGMMAQLDDFSAIIWPDELARFRRATQGKLVGIGVSIEYDPQSNVRVISPIEGTPAQRAGIHAGDIIKKVDGHATYGMSLDQAVDVITGPANTKVRITVEREDPDNKDARQDLDFEITRAVIDISTVKGWKRTGAKETDWDWFIDKDNGIGYMRLTQFTDSSTREIDRAVAEMRAKGLNGLVFDLRFNPGGLLEQAVEIVRRFVDAPDALIVAMSSRNGHMEDPQRTRPARASLAHIPIVVLINENSASASEIVSGALRYYGEKGGEDDAPAIRCLVLGDRSYGKGSVQNVYTMGANAMMKLTIQYYMLPSGKIIHRKPGAEAWGVDPDMRVELLPKQIDEALTLRRNADVVRLDEHGAVPADAATPANPDDLLAKGIDLQLETALVVLQSQVIGQGAEHARAGK